MTAEYGTPTVTTAGANTNITLSDGTQITMLNDTSFKPGQYNPG